MSLVQDIITDLKGKSLERSTKEKNDYRWKIVALMGVAAVGCFVIGLPWLAILPALVAARKVWIIQVDH